MEGKVVKSLQVRNSQDLGDQEESTGVFQGPRGMVRVGRQGR